ncbi:IS630 family transposase, partial [Actinacidiphila oryziradicis]
MEQIAELRELVNSRDVPAVVATRARIVLWSGEGRRRKDVAELAGVS